MIYLQLLYSYLKIGFFGFGGGYAILALIQNEIVVRHHWLTNSELTDIIAISQMTPGPIAINSATYVGYTVTGNIWGSLLATFALTPDTFIDGYSWAIMAVAFIASVKKMSPILVICLAGVAGYLIYGL